MRRLRHAPLDRCMYCLARGVPRTEEHLIPRALGGRLTLRDAVCEPCRRATGRLEQHTLEREFVVPKTLLALKRRRARAAGPARLPPVLLQGEAAPAVLAPDAFPRGFWLPAWRGASPPEFVRCTLRLGRPAHDAVAAPPALPDPAAYAWSIAKWAYALAVAERGLDGFDTQAARDLMLGRRDDVFAFVATPTPPAAPPRDRLHDFAVRDRGAGVTVTLALFASAGMAPYEVAL